MMSKYDLLIVHALDETTKFLLPFKNEFLEFYWEIKADHSNIQDTLNKISQKPKNSVIVFLGHGHSTGLYAPNDRDNIFIDKDKGNELFINKNILLLSCNSNQFIKKLNTYRHIIGFGDILSSMEEVRIRSEYEANICISNEDIKWFYNTYIQSIIKTLRHLLKGQIEFTEVAKYIEFYINKEINRILRDKTIINRKERAKLLFEFKNEMFFRCN
jgi:hypothetical protein